MMTLLRLTLLCMSIVTYVGAQTTSSIGDIDSTGSGDYISTSESATASSATEVITSEAPSYETESSTSSSPSVNSTFSSTNTSIPAVENSTSPSPSVNSTSSTNTSVPAVGNATSSSLNATTATTTSKAAVVTENPCSNDPCPENSNCHTSGSSYECICVDGYMMLDGDTCIKVCEPKSYPVNNEQVYYDVTPQACDNLTLYPPTNMTFDVLFGQSQVGTTVTANITCNATCETNGAPGAIGYATCEASGTYSQPTWIDCSVTDPTTNQKLSTAIIATSEPDEVDASTVDDTVVVLKEVSSQDSILPETADQFMAVTNNLLRSSGTGAQDQVQNNSDAILQSVQDTTQNVNLDTVSNGYNSYENVQSDIAMGVAQTSSAARAVRAAKAGGSTVSYVFDGEVTPNLASTGVSLSYSDPPSDLAYISAMPPSGSERISFIVYTSIQQLFPDTENFDILSNNIVFGVSGSTEYTMQFPITSDISIGVGATNKFNNTKRLECIKWDTTKWSTTTDCNNYAANHNVASCTCSGSGEFTIRSVEIQVNDELSPGAIVGIVIGSLAGVAIIGGLVYYFVFREKKKNEHNIGMSDTDSATNEL